MKSMCGGEVHVLMKTLNSSIMDEFMIKVESYFANLTNPPSLLPCLAAAEVLDHLI